VDTTTTQVAMVAPSVIETNGSVQRFRPVMDLP
jgi:hypothetical protein